MSIEAYPLHWPVGYARTPSAERKTAQFNSRDRNTLRSYQSKRPLTVADAVKRLQSAVGGFTKPHHNWRTEGLVVSTNVPVRNDGFPYSNAREPEDPGVAVYFHLDRRPLVFSCDRWKRVADNIAAEAATLEAMRGIERWGVTETERAFTGFAALPEKAMARTCWVILGVACDAPPDVIKAAYKDACRRTHPDTGGSAEAFHEVQEAWNHIKQLPGGGSL